MATTGSSGASSQPPPMQLVLSTSDLSADMSFFIGTLRMRLDMIYPADDPRVAVLTGHGLQLRLQRQEATPGTPVQLRLPCDSPAEFADGITELTAPNGTRISLVPMSEPLAQPVTEHGYVVRRLRDEAPWVIGRAGMHYRDLIPSRLGGSIIASHIRIPDGGPVPDMVHYHTVGFQLIYCYRGWVDVLYEDQGDMLRLHAGDCVTQPPEIRHRVCHASADIEVVEIGVPAEHVTTIDHDFELPNGIGDPLREWQGQRFVHHQVQQAQWQAFRLPGFECRDTGVAAGTRGIAGIQVYRPATSAATSSAGGVTQHYRHAGDIHFSFVLEGEMTLLAEAQPTRHLRAGDAFVVPPQLAVGLTDCSADLEVLEVALPGAYATELL